jgi:hypothetical protein
LSLYFCYCILPFWCVFYVRQPTKTAARDLVLHVIDSGKIDIWSFFRSTQDDNLYYYSSRRSGLHWLYSADLIGWQWHVRQGHAQLSLWVVLHRKRIKTEVYNNAPLVKRQIFNRDSCKNLLHVVLFGFLNIKSVKLYAIPYIFSTTLLLYKLDTLGRVQVPVSSVST